MKKLSISVAIALLAFAGVTSAAVPSTGSSVSAQPCCKGSF